jgi:hypothetical protein
MTDRTHAAVRVVGRYVDGLDVSVYGEPRPSVFEALRKEKGALRASPHGLREFGSIAGVPGGDLVLTTEGSGWCHFVLKNPAIKRLELTNRGECPQLMVQYRARTLHEHNLEKVGAVCDSLASFFLKGDHKTRVRRFDLAVDFQCEGWEMPEVKDVIGSRTGWKVHGRAERPTGTTFGSGKGPLQVVIYNKSGQVKGSEAEWVARDAWARAKDYDEGLPVIRVELRFFRKVLRQFKRPDSATGQPRGVDTITDLNSSIGDLVGYVVGGGGRRAWIRVASPDTRNLKSERREAASWWQAITRALLEGAPETGRIRQRSSSSSPDLRRTHSTLVTLAVQIAAREKAVGEPPVSKPEEYLGPILLQHLPGWLAAKDFGSFEEAVNFEVKKRASNGEAP